MGKAFSLSLFTMLIYATAHGFRPVTGPAWYLGGAGIPVLIFVIAVLLHQFSIPVLVSDY
jgi:hypothetical protein